MSITLVNKALYIHEQSKYTAMFVYPHGHPTRRDIWEQYNVPVVGSDDFHISEWAWVSIRNALCESQGWKGTIFPCTGEKRTELLKALKALLDLGVGEPERLNIELPNSIVKFNEQTVFDALEGLIALIERNDEIFAL